MDAVETLQKRYCGREIDVQHLPLPIDAGLVIGRRLDEQVDPAPLFGCCVFLPPRGQLSVDPIDAGEQMVEFRRRIEHGPVRGLQRDHAIEAGIDLLHARRGAGEFTGGLAAPLQLVRRLHGMRKTGRPDPGDRDHRA